ncbi:MAG TPA: HD-GYP domain-containing protein [Atribacteraceae bacterium]|nr:HD-GYP domain-containing protein [Atribacteraceae bacterium]
MDYFHRSLLEEIKDPRIKNHLAELFALKHEELLQVFQSLDEVIFIRIQETGEILFVNAACEKRYGKTDSLRWEKISHAFQDPLNMMDTLFPERKEIQGLSEWEVLNRMDNHWYRCREIPLLWPDGQLVLCLLASDITELKQLRVELVQSRERFEKTTFGTIQAMGKIVEMRDPYTAGHQKRVAQLASFITREMGLAEDKVDCCFLSSLVHDIGKIYIPTEILLKPGPLTDIEYAMIKVHPQVGYDILKSVEFPWPIGKIVLQHHERIDGSGYPEGLRGAKILLEARIIAVADTVEAMFSQRPFRKERDFEEVMEEIAHNRDTLYDTDVVDACLKTIAENKIKTLWLSAGDC